MKQEEYSRRKFVKEMAVRAASFMLVLSHVLYGKGFFSPNDKITVRIIGTGGKAGKTPLRHSN